MPVVETTLSEVLSLARQKSESAVAAFDRLVRGAADGRPLDPVETLAVIAAAGKTPDEFAAAVKRLVRRIELAALVASIPGLNEQLAEADDALAELEVEREAYLAELSNRRARAERLKTAVAGELAAAKLAKNELYTGAVRPDLDRAEAAIATRIAEAERLVEGIDSQLAGCKRTMAERNTAYYRALLKSEQQPYDAAAASAAARAEKLTARKAELVADLDSLRLELEAVRERRLEP